MSWWASICAGCGEGQRPGGFELTDRAAALGGISADSRLLDVACGGGATLRHLRETYGCEALGVEKDPTLCGGGVLCGSAEALPFESGRFDGVLIECALSQFEDADAALAECARVLKRGGFLAITDLYARDGAEHPDSCMGRVESRAALERRLARWGFAQLLFEDHSDALTSLWAGAILSGDESASGLRSAAKAAGMKPGYCLLLGRKP